MYLYFGIHKSLTYMNERVMTWRIMFLVVHVAILIFTKNHKLNLNNSTYTCRRTFTWCENVQYMYFSIKLLASAHALVFWFLEKSYRRLIIVELAETKWLSYDDIWWGHHILSGWRTFREFPDFIFFPLQGKFGRFFFWMLMLSEIFIRPIKF
jgi:hypothetical protein